MLGRDNRPQIAPTEENAAGLAAAEGLVIDTGGTGYGASTWTFRNVTSNAAGTFEVYALGGATTGYTVDGIVPTGGDGPYRGRQGSGRG